MKKIIYFVIILLGIVAGVGAVRLLRSSTNTQTKAQVLPAYTVVSSPTPTPSIALKPITLIIPKLHINAEVEEVGLDSKGAMDVPKKEADVGWYSLGVKPGEVGNAVVAGHFDDVLGKPAVFYHLADLKQGDTIEIINSGQKKLEFTVEEVKSYPTDSFPLTQVFGESNKRRLNLITYDGIFNKSKKLYSQRLVIYSILSNY